MTNQTKISIFLILITLLFASFAMAEVLPSDKTKIQNQVTLIANSVNNNEINSIVSLISPNARSTLKIEIENHPVIKKVVSAWAIGVTKIVHPEAIHIITATV